jgi:hypothetical protein
LALPASLPRHARHTLDVTALGVVLFTAGSIVAAGTGSDAYAYWSADGYGQIADTRHAFLYTPPFLVGLQPLQLLPWEAFRMLWLASQVAALIWLAGPIIAALVLLPGPYSPVYVDLWYGNIMVFSAAVLVAGFRNRHWWAVLPFGKVTPGIALLAGGWRPAATAAAIAGGTFVLAPNLWFDWADAMLASLAAPPENGLAGALIPRVVISAALVGLFVMRGWRWTVLLAVMLAQPVLWFSSLTIMLAVVRLWRDGSRRAVRPASRLLPVPTGTIRRQLVPIPIEASPARAAVAPQRDHRDEH